MQRVRITMQLFQRWKVSITIVGLLALFNVSELWVHGLARWLLMVTVLVLMIYICLRATITLKELGLKRADVRSGLRWGLACVAVIVIVLGVAFAVRSQLFIDSRYHIGWPKALLTMFVVIPLQTVLFEEFMFRGVLLASFRRQLSDRWAVALVSIAFGLWHIVPSLHLAASSEALGAAGDITSNAQLSAIIVTVFATSIAGAFLCWLRIRSQSLIAPILAHWAINACSVALVVAAYARIN